MEKEKKEIKKVGDRLRCLECKNLFIKRTSRNRVCSVECRVARKQKLSKQWRKKNKEHLREWAIEYREKNIDHIREYDRNYKRKMRAEEPKLEELINEKIKEKEKENGG